MHTVRGAPHPTITDDAILGFFQDYRFLSNFTLCSVELDGIIYPSSEHAYMAHKTSDPKEKEEIAALETPRDARKYGVSMYISTPNWERVKLYSMARCLHAKFNQNPYLMNVLKATGSKYLEETNYWGDDYWGKCTTNGFNHLGQLLMFTRSVG